MTTQAFSLKTILQHKFGTGSRTLSERTTAKEITGYQQVNDSNFGADDTIEDIAVSKFFAIFSNDTITLTIERTSAPTSTQEVTVNGLYVFTPVDAAFLISITNPGDEPVSFSCFYS